MQCQFQVLSRYWARDNSVRWLLLDFQVDVLVNKNVVYKLTNDKPASPIKDGITTEQRSDAIIVKTGKLETHISTKRCSLFEKVSFAGTDIIQASEHDGPTATTEEQSYTRMLDGDWNLHGWSNHKTAENQRPIKRADYFGDVGEPDEVIIERNCPTHVIVRVRGVCSGCMVC